MPRNTNAFYIEPNGSGGFKVSKGGAGKASATAPTQKRAIAKAKKIDPDAPIHAARVRHVKSGSPDKFRKVK